MICQNLTTSYPLTIGYGDVGTHDSPFRHFDGWIDDVSIWERMLSDSEILQIYNDGVSGQPLI